MKIVEFRPEPNGMVVAKLSVEIPQWHMVVREVALLEKAGKQWLKLPNVPRKDSTGQTEWVPAIDFPDEEVKKRFYATLNAELKRYQGR